MDMEAAFLQRADERYSALIQDDVSADDHGVRSEVLGVFGGQRNLIARQTEQRAGCGVVKRIRNVSERVWPKRRETDVEMIVAAVDQTQRQDFPPQYPRQFSVRRGA